MSCWSWSSTYAALVVGVLYPSMLLILDSYSWLSLCIYVLTYGIVKPLYMDRYELSSLSVSCSAPSSPFLKLHSLVVRTLVFSCAHARVGQGHISVRYSYESCFSAATLESTNFLPDVNNIVNGGVCMITQSDTPPTIVVRILVTSMLFSNIEVDFSICNLYRSCWCDHVLWYTIDKYVLSQFRYIIYNYFVCCNDKLLFRLVTPWVDEMIF